MPPPTSTRRRRARIALGLIGVALVASACLPSPIHPDNRASPIPNAQNGYLGDDLLRAAAPTCEVWRDAAPSLGSMMAAARRDGVQLAPLECYRDYAAQVEMRNDWCWVGACHMAAVPGTSNHGWAKAADLADQNGELTFDSPGYHWLKANAATYGWNHPGSMEPGGSAPEPWHWEWVGDGGRMFPGQTYGVGDAASLPAGGWPVGNFEWGGRPTTGGAGVRVIGWTIDPDTTQATLAHVYIDGAYRGSTTAARSRTDVAGVYPMWGALHGFDFTVAATPGLHHVCVWALNKVGSEGNSQVGCKDVTVTAP